MQTLTASIRRTLAEQADPARQESSRRFFKEEIQCYGLTTPQVRAIVKDIRAAVKNWPKPEIFALCEELWRSGYREESAIAGELVFALKKQFSPEDFTRFEEWIEKYITNWACCDLFCTQAMAAFLMLYPEFLPELKTWTGSSNRWKKRAAAVSLVTPARKGLWLENALEIAGLLLEDEDDMVQKGYGWLLKVTSQAYPDEVFGFVMNRAGKMPRTALRYAVEKFPKEQRAKVLGK